MAQYIYTMNRVSKVVPPKRTILRDISLSFFPGAKIGVLGLNGSGKSSLLRIMAGTDASFDGEARPQSGIRVGFLPQEPELDDAKDVRSTVMEGVGETFKLLEEFNKISEKFAKFRLRFGFMEQPNVPKARVIARKQGWQFDIMSTSFFVSRRSLKASAQSGMPLWQDHLFIALSRSANDATDYFQIPTGRVVEVGTQVTI